jgi:demethylmenaquinone methyltransferase / 2-methoxy-6-polyprenyl-1,4-benzoquinol methylase
MNEKQLPDEKKKFVKEKFSSISGRYDLLNSLLSLQIDRYWRWRTTRLLRKFPDGWVVDLCAGTLPLSLELTRQASQEKGSGHRFLRGYVAGRGQVPACG